MDVLLLLGASVRAAAFSARRASIPTTAIDLFADSDLVAVCPVRAIARDDYPGGFAAMAREAPQGPWLYTGALENHPELVDRIAASRPLWGNPGAVLRAVRDPLAVAAMLKGAGFPCPEARSDATGLPRDGSWLQKPLASGGGAGIRPLGQGNEARSRCYYQQRVDGLSLSAVFIAGCEGAVLAGVTRQLIGRPGAEFAYVGSVGPWPVTPSETERIGALGNCLAVGFGLRGIFGVDFILRDGQPRPVEVNPRYTASVEVLELALGRSLIGEHRRVFDRETPDFSVSSPASRDAFVGKRILFAPSRCHFPDQPDWQPPPDDPFALPDLADIPAPRTEFGPGAPVITLFAHADSPEECLRALVRSVSFWEHRLLTQERHQIL